METAKKPSLELIKRKPDLPYKIIIPVEVEKKIRLLCTHISQVEWSGVLFYQVEGAFNDKDNPLTIKCVDIFQMDKGTGGYTEFNVSPDIVSYMIDHPELLSEDVFQGLIHSHNNMATFFSGTDTGTLSQEGEDMAHFVSLIVNNAGTYSAAVTRRYKAKQQVKEEFTYPTWKEGEVTGTDEFEAEEEYLEWFPIEIQKETVPVDEVEKEMLARMKEIDAEKAKKVYKSGATYGGYNGYGNNYGTTGYQSRYPGLQVGAATGKPAGGNYVPVGQYEQPKKEFEEHKSSFPAQGSSYPAPTQKDLPFEKPDDDYAIPYGTVRANAKVVDWLVRQIITGSIILPVESKVDINKWMNSMDKVYSDRFDSVKEFDVFASNFIDFLVNYTTDETLVDILDDTEMIAILAYEVRLVLEELPSNVWMESYIRCLDDYIL